MGQRLNIEMIGKDGDTVANAYYHWSAYTSSSADLLKLIAKKYLAIKDTIKDEALLAVRLLESTGAGVDEAGLIDANNKWPNEKFKKAKDRNDGIISISEKEMAVTRDYEEGRINFYLEDGTADFRVLNEIDESDGYMIDDLIDSMNCYEELGAEYEDYNEMEEEEKEKIRKKFIDSLPEIADDTDYQIAEIPAKKASDFADRISKVKGYVFKWKGEIIDMIE